MVKFNEMQQQAIQHFDGACGVIASAGSGKCLKGDSLILTERGIIQIDEIPNHFEVNSNNECVVNVYSLNKNKNDFIKNNTSHFYNMGMSKTIKLTTSYGYEIEGTPEHPVIVLNDEGDLEFKELQNIVEQDIVAIVRNSNMWGNDKTFSEDLAYLFGLLIGDGYLNENSGKIGFSKNDDYLRGKYIELLHKLFKNYPININIIRKKESNSCDVNFYNMKLKHSLENDYGLKMELSEGKEIPQLIMMSPKNITVKCLQGLFDTDGTFDKKGVFEYSTKSPKLIRQVQTILLNLGIISSVKKRKVKNYEDTYYYLYISGSNLRLFHKLINFRYAREKKDKLENFINLNKKVNDNIHLFYKQGERIKRIRENFKGKSYYSGSKQKLFNSDISIGLRDYIFEKRNLTKQSIQKILTIIDFKNEDTEYLDFLSKNIFLDKIANIKKSESVVYDFTVPDTHSFVSNGFISHNTTILLNRINNLVSNHNIPESDILTISFTRNTADELKAKLNKMGYTNVNVGTFHSVCGKILSQEGIYLTPQNLIKDWQVENLFRQMDNKADVNEIKSFISYQKNYMKMPDDEFVVKNSFYSEEDLRVFYKKYEEHKKQNKLYDFDDYLLLAYDVVSKNKGKYTFEYILVDEHQDTNLVQNKLLKEICPSGNMFVVFDQKQAIYSFRGGNPEYCMNFENDWGNSTIINMNINYRSVNNIVEGANKFIRPHYKHYKHYKDAIANNKSNGIITKNSYINEEMEAKEVADKIEQLIKQGESLNEIAVLYRLNSQSAHIENELKARDIEYEISGDGSFFKRREIAGILSYLRLIHNPHDDVAFENVFKLRNFPLQYFSNKIFNDIKRVSGINNKSLYETFIDTKFNKPWMDKNAKVFRDSIERLTLQHKKFENVGSLISNVIKAFQMEEYIKNKYTNPEELKDRLRSLEILKGFVKSHDLEQFISFCYGVNTKKRSKKDVVKLMTVHASKGLEFNQVFIIGIQDSKFPHEWSDIEEEARLFYVAVTRPKKNLYISEIGAGSKFINEYFGDDEDE